MNLDTKQKQTLKRNILRVTKGERMGGGINEENGINRYKVLYIKGFTIYHMEFYAISCNNL